MVKIKTSLLWQAGRVPLEQSIDLGNVFGFGLSIENRRNEGAQAFLKKIFCNFWNKKSQALLGGRSSFEKFRTVQKVEFDDVEESLKICSRSLKICLEAWKSAGRAPKSDDGRTADRRNLRVWPQGRRTHRRTKKNYEQAGRVPSEQSVVLENFFLIWFFYRQKVKERKKGRTAGFFEEEFL